MSWVRAADDDGLVRVVDVDAFQTGQHRQGGMLPELVRCALENVVGEMKIDDAVGFAVLELHAAHENIFRRELALVLVRSVGSQRWIAHLDALKDIVLDRID